MTTATPPAGDVPGRRDPLIASLDLIGTREAAEVLGVVEQRIRQLITAGDLPAERIGERTWVMRRAAVQALLPED